MKILYVEDEPNDAQLVERYVRSTQHELVIARTIEEALLALSSDPDLILVDLVIGQVRQGYAFVRQLRGQGYSQPVVAITGLSLPRDVEQCIEVGCNEVITKPYMITELAEVISKYGS